jgi:hypothetical protein
MQSLIQWYRAQSPADQRALSLLGIAALLMTLFFGGLQASRASAAAEDRWQNRKAEFDQVVEMAQPFLRAQAERGALEKRMKRLQVSLESELESAAQRTDLEIQNMKNQSPRSDKGAPLAEERIRVTIKGISMDQFTRFIATLLDGPKGALMRVREVTLKTRFEDRKMLNVTFVVSTWRAKG